ncbi:MAG: HEPN domain-containing protein [Candidatus Caldatribacteriaceae bacterium]
MSNIENFITKAEQLEHLLALGDYDSCASRCYYAMFYMAEAALMTQGVTPSSHRGVIALFGKHFVQSGLFPLEFGRMFRKAYDVRLVGDYTVDTSVSWKEAETPVEDARRFVAQVRAYLETQG